jgi:hypothetical protein
MFARAIAICCVKPIAISSAVTTQAAIRFVERSRGATSATVSDFRSGANLAGKAVPRQMSQVARRAETIQTPIESLAWTAG